MCACVYVCVCVLMRTHAPPQTLLDAAACDDVAMCEVALQACAAVVTHHRAFIADCMEPLGMVCVCVCVCGVCMCCFKI